MPKKKIVQEVPEVERDEDLDVVTEFMYVAADATKAEALRSRVLVAYADFDEYEAGDVFTPPAGWVRDDGFEEFRSVSHKNKGGGEVGIAFSVPGEIIDTKTKERLSRRVVLPLKEA